MHKLNWDDLRIFLAVARTGRFAAAASRLGIDHTTVARRIGALEGALGTTLIARSPHGAELTTSGKKLLEYAERMESDAIRACESLDETASQISGTVRLATPEAFGSWLVAPNVHRLATQYPRLQLELVSGTQMVSLAKREADIAVVFNRPPKGRLVAQLLAGYTLGLYATREYLTGHPPIHGIDDLRNHRIVWYVEDLLDFPELHFLGEIISETPPGFRSNSVVAQHAAVIAGAGLGVVHAFVAAQDPRLVPVLPGAVRIQRAYWMTLQSDLRHVPRIRAVVNFLKATTRSNLHLFGLAANEMA